MTKPRISLLVFGLILGCALWSLPKEAEPNSAIAREARGYFGLNKDVEIQGLNKHWVDGGQGYYLLYRISCRKDDLDALLAGTAFAEAALEPKQQLMTFRGIPWLTDDDLIAIVRSGEFLSASVRGGETRSAVLVDLRDPDLAYIYLEDTGG